MFGNDRLGDLIAKYAEKKWLFEGMKITDRRCPVERCNRKVLRIKISRKFGRKIYE